MKTQADAALLESLFRTMAQTIPCALYDYSISAEGGARFLSLGDEAAAILEMPCSDLLADMSLFWDLIYPKDIAVFREEHRHAYLERKPFLFDVRMLMPSGKVKWIRIASQPHAERADGLLLRSGFMCDVTELKAMEQKASELDSVRREKKAVEASNAALRKTVEEKNRLLKKLSLTAKTSGTGALIGALAHELGQPLTAIHLASFRALDLWQNRRNEATSDPDRLVVLLNNIDRYQSRVVDLIAGVRQLFRRGAKDFEPINLSELIGDVLEIAERGFAEEKIALQTDIEPEVSVIGDVGQLQMVLLNLVNNACNALRDANAKRRLSLHLKRDGRQAVLDISDNGPGLPAGKEDQVFSLLHAEGSEERGIGLWLCREIVSNHGGCLYARNRPGGGAKFTLELPT